MSPWIRVVEPVSGEPNMVEVQVCEGDGPTLEVMERLTMTAESGQRIGHELARLSTAVMKRARLS